MHLKNKLLQLLVTGTAAIGFAASANAALIAYEGFDYAQQTALSATANTGIGWTTNWDSGSWRTNYSGYSEITTGLSCSWKANLRARCGLPQPRFLLPSSSALINSV